MLEKYRTAAHDAQQQKKNIMVSYVPQKSVAKRISQVGVNKRQSYPF